MKLTIACVVLFLAAIQAQSEEVEFNEDSYWPYSNQNQADLQQDIEDPAFERYLLRIARKSRPSPVIELIAKRSKEFKRMSPKRHKIESFIGLMGKRSLSPESEESDADLNLKRRR
ncbi:protachykinin-1-like [Spea bombifrons]|uniref:protachykinin-1-like n=1 Tax=Spea bombifrons TaxID=233779 RepID=UPI00234BE83E|nr:protachykinin-1-like [Spea bombifrons]